MEGLPQPDNHTLEGEVSATLSVPGTLVATEIPEGGSLAAPNLESAAIEIAGLPQAEVVYEATSQVEELPIPQGNGFNHSDAFEALAVLPIGSTITFQEHGVTIAKVSSGVPSFAVGKHLQEAVENLMAGKVSR